MRMRIVLVAALLTNSFIGSLCAIPMASAMSMENHVDMQHMGPMSHVDCDNCPHEKHKTEKQMPCDSGHCLSAHKPEALVSLSVTIEMRMPAPSSALPISLPEQSFDQPFWQSIIEGPPPETGISTIVLRQ